MANSAIVGEGRFDFVSVFEPRKDEKGREKYGVCFIIPKTDTKSVKAIMEAQHSAFEQGVKNGLYGHSIPKTIPDLLHDGDEEREGNPAYMGAFYINAKSNWAPEIISQSGKKIATDDEFYSGCYGFAHLTFYPYNVKGQKGVLCAITHIMRTRKGEPLKKAKSAIDIFAGLIVDDDLPFVVE